MKPLAPDVEPVSPIDSGSSDFSELRPNMTAQDLIAEKAVLIGTESVGIAAWDLWQTPDGLRYQVVVFPAFAKEFGQVYAASRDSIPAVSRAPELQRTVSAAERAEFADRTALPRQVSRRVAEARSRLSRAQEREDSWPRAWQSLRLATNQQQQGQWEVAGYYDVFCPNGMRFRIRPTDLHVFLLGPTDQPLTEYWIDSDEVLPEAAAAHVLRLANDPAWFLARASSHRYTKADAPWPLLGPVPGAEAAGRMYALEVLSS